jgi:predicted RNA-binding protein with PIN domain
VPTAEVPADRPAAVALAEPARKQLVEIAADLLGRLPAEQVPVSLRPFVRFTPARRRQRGAVQIAAVLDTDDAFRAAVAAAVTEALPDLVEAVAAGTSTAASDPVDVAVAAYLVRPAGWPDVVAAATERWRAQRRHQDAFAEERSRLQAEIGELRTKLRAQAVARRAAADEAGAGARARLADSDKRLRARTAALRAAERERDGARAVVADTGRRAEAAAADAEVRLRRLRSRIAELEQAAGAARRGTRVERDLDDARLWLLVETLGAAAAGIRRELSLAPPSRHPADALAAGLLGGDPPDELGTRAVRDQAGVQRFLSLPQAHLIVDGYNVTMTGYGELALADQRDRLVAALAAVAGRCGAEITVAFDGRTRPTVQPRWPRGVRVLFSAAEQIADDLIRALVAAEPAGRPLLVATSDQQVVADVRRAGAWTVASDVLLAALR